MALLIAALGAEGQSVINNVGQIERGYERMDERLVKLGADVKAIDTSSRMVELSSMGVCEFNCRVMRERWRASDGI